MSAEGQGVSPTGAASGADLGGSSKHSTESTEGRAEKGSSSTAFERGLVDPKSPANAFSRAWRHGSREIKQALWNGYCCGGSGSGGADGSEVVGCFVEKQRQRQQS